MASTTPRNEERSGPDRTAARVALWRALHVQVDPPPHVFEDEIGLRLVAPDDGWRRRPDMSAVGTRRSRASIVARARFLDDLVAAEAGRGVRQFVLLGAGLDTFAQRRPDLAASLTIFEVDQPETQAWKKRRLVELGYGLPGWLRFVPVNFESGAGWREQIAECGFATRAPAIVASTGVSMYLTPDANAATLRQAAALAPGSTLAMTFMLPLDLLEPEERPQRQSTEKFARAAGTPFLSFFAPAEALALARECGFRKTGHVSAADLERCYFRDRTDGLRPSSSEELLVATI